MAVKGNCFLIVGPSGSGKTVLVNSVTTNRAVTTTTRKPRLGEKEGIDYYFLSKKEFKQLIEGSLLIEWAEYGKADKKNYYGLTKEEFEKRLLKGDLFIICTVEGVKHYKKVYPQSIIVFIESSFQDIQKQLHDRGGKKEDIQDRISLYKEEMKTKKLADYVIVNQYGNLTKAIKDLKQVISLNKSAH